MRGLVATLYGFLLREGRISDDWFARQIAQADHIDGDIDTLSTRIAHIRTWTFAANRPDWLGDPEHWQGATRAIEDRLSDALHERLAERFVDRRTSVLMRRLRENTVLDTEITKTGEVVVEGHPIGRLDGFRFAPDTTSGGSDAKALSAAAQKALAGEIEARANKLAHAPDAQFVLTSDATIRWQGEPVAKIIAGDIVLRPRVKILADEHLTGTALEAVQTRLDLWTRTHIERLLGPLFVLGAAEDITGLARGIAFQLVEALGVLERSRVAEELKSLDQASRAVLRKHGVRFGAYHVYVPLQLKPAPRALAAQLWALKHGGAEIDGLDELQRLAGSGRTSFPADKEVPRPFYRTIGYRVCGERAVRVDILERLADLIRPALAWRPGSSVAKPAGAFDGGTFTVTQAMTSLTGSSGEDFASILRALGYRAEKRPKPVAEAVPVAVGAGEARADGVAADETAQAAPAATASGEAGRAAEDADHGVAMNPAAAVEMPTAHDAADMHEPVHEARGVEEEPAPHDAREMPELHKLPAMPAAPDEGGAAHQPEPIVPPPEAPQRDIAPIMRDAVPPADGVAAEALAAGIAPEVPAHPAEIGAGFPTATGGETASETAEEAAAAGAERAAGAAAAGQSEATPAVEPELVEVWRPGGRSDERHGQRRPPRPPRRHHRESPPAAEPRTGAPAQPAAAGSAAASEGVATAGAAADSAAVSPEAAGGDEI